MQSTLIHILTKVTRCKGCNKLTEFKFYLELSCIWEFCLLLYLNCWRYFPSMKTSDVNVFMCQVNLLIFLTQRISFIKWNVHPLKEIYPYSIWRWSSSCFPLNSILFGDGNSGKSISFPAHITLIWYKANLMFQFYSEISSPTCVLYRVIFLIVINRCLEWVITTLFHMGKHMH